MSKSDLSEMINNQEDSTLWIHSILAKRFMHLINKGIQEEWLELKGEYVHVSFSPNNQRKKDTNEIIN